jgi:cell division protein FtsN
LKEKGYIARLVESGDGFFRVWIGKFSKEEDAKKEKEKIEESGYPVIVKKIDSEKKLKETEVKIVVKEQAKRKQVISKKSEEKSETSYSQIFVKNFSDHKSAENLRNELSKKGYFSYILVVKNNYKVMVGKTSQESLEEIVERLKKDGYPAILVP